MIESVKESDFKELFNDVALLCITKGDIYLYGLKFLFELMSKSGYVKILSLCLRYGNDSALFFTSNFKNVRRKIFTTTDFSKVKRLELNKLWIEYLVENTAEIWHVIDELMRVFNTIEDPKLILSHGKTIKINNMLENALRGF